MLLGTVASKLDDKGFGFIHPKSGGEDLFFHRSAVEGEFETLRIGQEVHYTVDTAAAKMRAKTVSPCSGSAPGQLPRATPHARRDHRPERRRLTDADFEFGFVTKLYRKDKQGFISANKRGKELMFGAMHVSGDTPYFRLQVGDYVRFTRHAASAEDGPPVAKNVQVTERKIRVDTGLDLPAHPKARRRKPSWR